MWFVFMLALACDRAPEVPADDLGPTADERLVSLKADVIHAHDAWAAERRREAVATVHAAYARHFEPMEPALRDRDPVGTLELTPPVPRGLFLVPF